MAVLRGNRWLLALVALVAALALLAASPALGHKKHKKKKAHGTETLTYSSATGDFTVKLYSKPFCADNRRVTLWMYPYSGGAPAQVGSATTDATGTGVFIPPTPFGYQAGLYAPQAPSTHRCLTISLAPAKF